MSALPPAAPFLSFPVRAYPASLHHPHHASRLHRYAVVMAPDSRTSDALRCQVTRRSTLLLVRPFTPSWRLVRPLLTSRSASLRRTFIHKARSPRVRTHSFTARPPDLRRLTLDHKSFAEPCPLALVGTALYPVLVHRPAASLHASFPRSVALPQLRFASLAVVSLREDFHLQECAHAGRTRKPAFSRTPVSSGTMNLYWIRTRSAPSPVSTNAIVRTGLRT